MARIFLEGGKSSFQPPTLLVLSILLVWIAPAASGATTVTFGYTGTITYADGAIEGFDELPYEVGDPITGAFTFDPDTPPSSSSNSMAAYYYSAVESATAEVGPISVTQDVVGVSAECSPAPDCSVPSGGWYETTMYLDATSYDDYANQAFWVDIFAMHPDLDVVVETSLYLRGGRGLAQYDDGVIPSTELPVTPFDPEEFVDARGSVARRWPHSGPSGWFVAQFSVDDMYLVSVPEPSSVLLLVASFVGANLAQRRRRSQ